MPEKKNPSKSLVREPPSPHSPNRGPMERDAPAPEIMVHSFIYICRVPRKKPECHAASSMIPSTLAWVDQSPIRQRVT